MIKDDKLYLNLEEQVQKNKEDITYLLTEGYATNLIGIKVQGQVNTPDDLPDPTQYLAVEGHAYGDTYAVGTIDNPPYEYYVFTRPFGPYLTDHWFNIGVFPGPSYVPGPIGPAPNLAIGSVSATTGSPEASITGTNPNYQLNLILKTGPQGPVGPQGLTGDTGPQGPQGVQGPQGDVGGFINIQGIVANAEQLPTPTSLGNLTVAYLVGAETPYDLYIQIGETSATAVWKNMGALNVGTYVTIDGNYVNVLEMANYQKKLKTVVLTVSGDASYGTITQEQLNILQEDINNLIKVDNDIYRISKDAVPSGYLKYVHQDEDSNNNIYTKVLTITISTKTFAITTQTTDQEVIENSTNPVSSKAVYPISVKASQNTASINGLSQELTNLKNALPVQSNTTRTNQNDTVVEYYMSSDNKTWYRKWASGWKECGVYVTATIKPPANGANTEVASALALPITFSNTQYTIMLQNSWENDFGHRFFWSTDKSAVTINTIPLVIVACTNNNNLPNPTKVGCFVYCCGY